MPCIKVLKKILSITLVVAFLLQQSSFAFAADIYSIDDWDTLEAAVEGTTLGEYQVTTALTASDAPHGTLDITSSGFIVTGASLTQNAEKDNLISITSSDVTFDLGNDIEGSIANSGTINYFGSGLLGGEITGTGNFNFTGTETTNWHEIAQKEVWVVGTASLINNSDITATTFSNSGTVTNNATITGKIINAASGTLNSTADNLAGAVTNDGTLNLAGGTVQSDIYGIGDLNITDDLANDYAIAQSTITNEAALTNNATITGTIINTEDGTIDSTADNLAGAVTNNGTLNLAGGTTQDVIDGTGTMNITADLLASHDITQNEIVNEETLVNGSNLVFDAFTNNGTLINDGGNINDVDTTSTFDNNGTLQVENGDVYLSSLTNNAGASVQVNGGQLTANTLVNDSSITNDAVLNTVNMTNNNSIDGTGTLNIAGASSNEGTITQALVAISNNGNFDNNGILTAQVSNEEGSTFSTDVNNFNGDVANDGRFNLEGEGTFTHQVTGTGTTAVSGYLTNEGTFQQGIFQVQSGAVVITDASDIVTTDSIKNAGILNFTAGSTANAITGVGHLDITGYVTNTGTIAQGTISNSSIFTNKGSVSGVIENSNSIEGNGTLTASANGVSFNTGTIKQNGLTNKGKFNNSGSITLNGKLTNQGTFTSDASLISTTTGITNTGTLHFTQGVNNNTITGATGTTIFSGVTTNRISVTQNTVSNDGTLTNEGTITASAINNSGTLTNDGTITGAVDNSGILTSAGNQITGTINNMGTYVISDGDNANTITGAGTTSIVGTTVNTGNISQNVLAISNAGTFTTAADTVTANINNEGSLIWNGGSTNANAVTGNGSLTIDAADITNNAAISQNTITINDTGALSSNADLLTSLNGIANEGTLTFTGGTNTNSVTGTGAVDVNGEVTNQATIDQDEITISGGKLTTNADLLIAANGITNDAGLSFIGGTNSNDISGTGTTYIDGTLENTGAIDTDIEVSTDGHFVGMADISSAVDNRGIVDLSNADVLANAEITGTGTTNILGNTINEGTIEQNALNIASAGSLTSNSDNVIAAIVNDGTYTINGGTSNANIISGNGALNITGGNIANTASISQENITITGGSLSTNAELLASANGITNNATNGLDLTGGTNTQAVNGTGSMVVSGEVTNNAAINQAALTNSGTLINEALITANITNTGTLDSVADNLAGAVTNDGTLNLAGGTVQDIIDGTGILNITDDLSNDYAIEQGTVNNSAYLTNNATITAAITNTGMIDSTADNLAGAVTNDGTLNLAGGTTQDVIDGTGVLNITDDLVNDYAITQDAVTNDGFLTNNALITAAINNNGTISGAAANLAGSVDNAGTLVFDAASTGTIDISGEGDIQVTADTTLAGANSSTGDTLVDGATLTIAGQDNLGTGNVLFANSGVLAITDAGSLTNTLMGQTASEDVSVQNDADLTLEGLIGSAADFHKLGAGEMTLAMASNDYTGNTYVDGGTLIGNTQNINNTVNGVAGTTVEFTDEADAELNGINTLGTFVKSGSGLLNVSNNAFSAAQVELNNGILAANRAMTADVLNVNDGATLRGNGNITGTVNVNNGGTIAPGNSIDTLTITGDVNFNNGSTTAIEINETPASDQLIISGNATIENGANLTVSNENGRYFEWDTFEIINAGNVSGEFTYDGTITDYDASRINVELDYSDPTKVVLTAKRKATDYAGTTEQLSRNQREVAKAVDAVSTGFGGDITNALLQLEALGGLNPDEVTLINPNATLQSALDDMDGVLYANSALLTLLNAKTAHVYDRIAKRAPSHGDCPNCHDNVWAEYYNQYDKVYANANSPHFTNTMTGVLVGYDRSSEEALLGVYSGFGKSKLHQRRDRMDLEDTSLGVYGGYMLNDWTFKGTLFGGHQLYHADRYIGYMGRSASAAYRGWSLALDLEGSYNIPVYNWLNVKPFAGVLSSYAHQKSFTETGAGDLNLFVHTHDQFNTQARLGIQLDGKIKNKLTWYGSVAVKQFIGGDYAKLHMNLGLPGTDMTIISNELGRTYFAAQVGLNYAINDNWSLYANLDTGASNRSANCYGNAGIAFTW